jgi:hypothetical protein
MPNTNTCNLSGVYVRYHDTATYGGVSEDSITDNVPFDVCLGLEAGKNLFNMPAAYNLHVALNDLSNSSTTVYTTDLAGTLGDAGWTTLDFVSAFAVPPASITPALDGHAFQVVGVMSVGKGDPIVEAKLSEIFIITQP